VGLDNVFDCDTHSIEPGDWIVLATDGVTKGLPRADQIATILAEARDPQHAAGEMTRRARLAGSGDDITALVVELVDW
jgi:serine/threonine protein phosphatase PrpC